MPYINKERKAAQYRLWRQANKEQLKTSKKAYYQANKDAISSKAKTYREINKDKIRIYRRINREKRKAQSKAWREANREKQLVYIRSYCEANKEQISLRNKAWRQANKEHLADYINRRKEHIKARSKAYRNANRKRIARRQAEKLQTNLQYKIRMRIRRRFLLSLRRAATKKTARVLSLIGCSIQDLIIFLENYFTPEMSWNNYGLQTWHIDHVRPCASFDLTDIKQQQLCFHWSNLRPILAHDNCVKSSKWNGAKSFYLKNDE